VTCYGKSSASRPSRAASAVPPARAELRTPASPSGWLDAARPDRRENAADREYLEWHARVDRFGLDYLKRENQDAAE
jgi:hypothetical protein